MSSNSKNISSKMFKKPVKKNVGLRTFFPEMPSSMSNLEKAKVWVKRHNNNYFMGWTQEQLQSLDPIVRPLTIITPELYKRHMNRSEYCRIVKLKYCLESDADWAKEFRRRLGTDSSKGGFRSLGEAKLYATQLWRQYSELYDVHRARIGNNNSKAALNKHHSTYMATSSAAKRSRGSIASSMHAATSSQTLELASSCLDVLTFTNLYPSVFCRDSSAVLGFAQQSVVEEPCSIQTTFSNGSNLDDNLVIKVEKEEKFDSQSVEMSGRSNWSTNANNVTQSNLLSIFPSVEQMDLTILEKVDILLRRRRKDFFLGWPEEQLKTLNICEQPLRPVTEKDYREYLFSEEGQLTSAVATVFDLTEPWAFRFKKMLHLSPEQGGFASWGEVKQELFVLLQNHLSGTSQLPDSASVLPQHLATDSHEVLSSLVMDTETPSTSSLAEKHSGSFDDMIQQKDQFQSSFFNSLSGGGVSKKKSSEINTNLERQAHEVCDSQLTGVSSSRTEAITIDDDTNSEENYEPEDESLNLNSKLSSDNWSSSSRRKPFATDAITSTKSTFPGRHNLGISSSMSLGPQLSSRFPLTSKCSRDKKLSLDQLQYSTIPATSKTRLLSEPADLINQHEDSCTLRSSTAAVTQSTQGGKISDLDWHKDIVEHLWNFRDTLADRCKDDPARSWHDKLRPHLKLIRSQLGETYTLPESVAECIADLVLVTLHQGLGKF